MKRFALITMLASLALSGSAVAGRQPDAPDGTLTIKGAAGTFWVSGRGAFIGHFDSGAITIRDANPDDGMGPIVTGAEQTRDINARTTRYSGTDIRFRMIGGAFVVNIVGRNVDLSVIGKGAVKILGAGTTDDGTYAVNGGPSLDVPFPLADIFQLVGVKSSATGNAGG